MSGPSTRLGTGSAPPQGTSVARGAGDPGEAALTVIQAMRDFVDLSMRSFENSSTTMERVHQSSAEMSLDLLKELGFPADVADSYREAHRRMLASSYGRVRAATQEFGVALVRAAEHHAPEWWGPTDPSAGTRDESGPSLQ